jgi:hypothetical protein
MAKTRPAKAAAKSLKKVPASKARPVAKAAAPQKAKAQKSAAPAEEAQVVAAPAAAVAAPASEAAPDLLGPEERALLAKLVLKTGLTPREVIGRALHAFGAPAAAAKAAAAPVKLALPPGEQAARRLHVSVDGKPAIFIDHEPFVVGSDAGCDLRIQLPLIAPRHAQILVREGRHIFEDLQSPRGSYLHGQRVDVRHLEDGDEIDLGGFLPLRFRLS